MSNSGQVVMRITFLVAVGLLPATATIADDFDNAPVIYISASRTAELGLSIPAGYQIIEREQITQSGARRIVDLLNNLSTVQVTDGIGGGGNANIDMRGFGASAASNVAVLVNGRKINSPTDASTPYLNGIDLENVERIEIIEGGAGTLYGNQAVGGLINVITVEPGKPSIRARAGIGGHRGREGGAAYSGRYANGMSLAFNANMANSDNYRDHNRSEVQRFSAQAGVTHGKGQTKLSFSHLDDYQETPGALLAAEVAADRRQVTGDFVNDYFDTLSQVWRLSTQQPISTRWRFEGDLSSRNDDRDFIQSFRGSGPGSIATQDRDSLEFNPRLHGKLGNTQLILGGDLQYSDYLLVSAFGPQGTEQKIHAIYGQAQHAVTDTFGVTAGLRHARVEDDITSGATRTRLDDEVTIGSLGLTYRPNNSTRLYARADQNYRFAKVDEHTNVVFGQNIGLKTQTGTSYETGMDWQRNGHAISARAYRLNLNNEISNDASAFLANVNLDETRRIGATFSAHTQINQQTTVGGSYDYIDSEIISGTHKGSQVPLVAEHRYTLFAQWQANDALQLRADLQYTGERVLGSDFANTAPRLENHTLVNLNANYRVKDWQLNVRINNLLNEKYNATGAVGFTATGYNPAPERHLMLTASYAFSE